VHDDKIVTLRGEAFQQRHRPDPEGIAALEEMLERLRAGNLVGYVFIGETADAAHTTIRSGPFGITAMIGRVERLKHLLVTMTED